MHTDMSSWGGGNVRRGMTMNCGNFKTRFIKGVLCVCVCVLCCVIVTVFHSS